MWKLSKRKNVKTQKCENANSQNANSQNAKIPKQSKCKSIKIVKTQKMYNSQKSKM